MRTISGTGNVEDDRGSENERAISILLRTDTGVR